MNEGFVSLEDSMGNDDTVVNVAKLSVYKKEHEMSEKQKYDFIKRLWSSGHTSPFEFVLFTFRIKCPIFVARQWMRHRTGRYLEKSLRYCEALPEFYTPEYFPQSQKNVLLNSYKDTFQAYTLLLKRGAKKEDARFCLPVSLFTEFVWNIDLHNLFHFLTLRMDRHAESEMQVYASRVFDSIYPIVPLCWQIFKEITLEPKREKEAIHHGHRGTTHK